MVYTSSWRTPPSPASPALASTASKRQESLVFVFVQIGSVFCFVSVFVQSGSIVSQSALDNQRWSRHCACANSRIRCRLYAVRSERCRLYTVVLLADPIDLAHQLKHSSRPQRFIVQPARGSSTQLALNFNSVAVLHNANFVSQHSSQPRPGERLDSKDPETGILYIPIWARSNTASLHHRHVLQQRRHQSPRDRSRL